MPAAGIQSEIINKRFFLGIESDKRPYGRLPGRRPPAWVYEGPLYEVFIRNFSSAGNLDGLIENIPYLKDLGIKTVWLMPLHPIGRAGRKGKLGCPYAIRDHLAINQHYGSDKDLRRLVSELHALDLRLIIDLVINHGALDHVRTVTHPAMFAHDRPGHFTRKIADWSDVIDFDYSGEDTRKYMLEVMSYWIKEFDIDGYRCDVAGMVPLDFWETAVEKLLKIKPDLFMLAEWQRPKLHRQAFHATYDWVTYLVLKDIYQNKRPAADILSWLAERIKLYPQNALPLLFTENHDFPRTLKTFGRSSFYPFVAMLFTLPGIPLVYNGQESGLKQELSLFDHDPLCWENKNQVIYDFYKNLIRLRRDNAALASKNIKVIKNDRSGSVVTFLKLAGREEVLVILNFGPQRQKIKISLPAQYHIREWQNLLNTRITRKGQELANIELKPYEVSMWKPFPLTSFDLAQDRPLGERNTGHRAKSR
jgi:cyclomaltodextrinase